MEILAIDSSGPTASVAILKDENVVTEFFLDNGLKHSETLVPLVDSIFKICNKIPKDIDLIALVIGPGSFTGVRIGVSMAKGIAIALDVPCVGVTSFEALAYSYEKNEAPLCTYIHSVGDEYYCAFFEHSNSVLKKKEPEAILTEDCLKKKISNTKNLVVIDNGIKSICKDAIHAKIKASCVGKIAFGKYKNSESCSADELNAFYLSRPQQIPENSIHEKLLPLEALFPELV
jgi:tRNA threonylcarbamoyladenosine biosynthesis protein TsaB